MQLEIDQREATMLNQVLTNYLPELKSEISNTESRQWRQDLKRDEEVIKGLIARLQPLVATQVSSTS